MPPSWLEALEFAFFVLFIFYLLNLFGWHWLIKLYRFQVYNSKIHHVYIVLCAHHPKSSLLSPSFVCIYPLQPPSNPLSLWSTFSTFLNPLNFFTASPGLLYSESTQSVPCIYESVSIFFVSLFCSLDSTCKWNHIAHVFLWLTYLN